MSRRSILKIYLHIVNSRCFMTICLYQTLQSLKMFSNTETSFKELDVFPSFGWSRDGVVIRKHLAPSIHIHYWPDKTGEISESTEIIHLILKSPIIGHAERVDEAGLLAEERIKANELVSVHLVVKARSSSVPVTTHSLQHSVTWSLSMMSVHFTRQKSRFFPRRIK